MINFLHIDCMEFMKTIPDKHYDLAIVDPPYGIKQDGHRENNRSKLAKSKKYHKALWDQPAPDKSYFDELFRISKNQIIWGANNYPQYLSKSPCWLVWDKKTNGNHFADCELAYGSFETAVRKFEFQWAGMLQGDIKNKQIRIHPTEKPIALYEWLLKNYAKPGQSIIDTHGGSFSHAIAVHNMNTKDGMNLSLDIMEIDEEYYQNGVERYHKHIQQLTIFQ